MCACVYMCICVCVEGGRVVNLCALCMYTCVNVCMCECVHVCNVYMCESVHVWRVGGREASEVEVQKRLKRNKL
jgi:hypothetical protein